MKWFLRFLLCISYSWQLYPLLHEAYIPAVTDCLPLKAIKKKPPKNKKEKVSSQFDENYIWISGYWYWDSKKDNFKWVNGIWRRPPPNHQWISGYWHKYKDCWAYVKGFWSPVSIKDLVYLPLPPLEIQNEYCECPGKNYQWSPGYWFYDLSLKDYTWLNGKWSINQQEGIHVPTHYCWYQKGYVCIPSFWDWPFDTRGEIDSCHEIAKQLLSCYPDYLYFYQYYTFNYPNFLEVCEWAPQWFGVQNWWSYSWNDHWNAWWCYTHANYFEPQWFSKSSDFLLNSPSQFLISYMQEVDSPLFIGQQSPYSYDILFSNCDWTNECLYPPIYLEQINSNETNFKEKKYVNLKKEKRGKNQLQVLRSYQNENFNLQWHYLCNRFYYRRLGFWLNLCRSYPCSVCRVDQKYQLEQLGYERGLISNYVLEQESQRVERFRFLSLLDLYGLVEGCNDFYDECNYEN